MKLDALRKIIREEVKGAIQEELKDILLEAVRAPKNVVVESTPTAPVAPTQTSIEQKAQLREALKNTIAPDMNFNSSHVQQPLRVTSTDTMSPNGRLPEGDVSMDQIMGLMNK